MAFSNFMHSYVVPIVMAAEEEEKELVDPQTELREECHKQDKINSLYDKYQACNDRVNGRSKTTETCMEELFDYVGELDHCVAHHGLFSKLK